MYIGQVVCSVSGHDKGIFMVVVGQDNKGLLVCDGKHHRIEKPKCKNIKHLRFTSLKLDGQQYQTNKAIRKAIFENFKSYKEEA